MSRDDPIKAAIHLTLRLDSALESGDTGFVHAVLQGIDPWSSHGDALIAVLSNIQGACLQLGGPLSATFQTLTTRTLDALEQKWGWGAEDLEEARGALHYRQPG